MRTRWHDYLPDMDLTVQAVEDRIVGQEVRRALDAVGEPQRSTLVMAYFTGLTHTDDRPAHRRPARHGQDQDQERNRTTSQGDGGGIMTGLDRHHRPEDPRDGESAGMTGAADDEWGEWSDEDLLGMPDEALGRLGASLEPIEPPASMRADLLERIWREPQVTGGAVGSGGSA